MKFSSGPLGLESKVPVTLVNSWFKTLGSQLLDVSTEAEVIFRLRHQLGCAVFLELPSVPGYLVMS